MSKIQRSIIIKKMITVKESASTAQCLSFPCQIPNLRCLHGYEWNTLHAGQSQHIKTKILT